MYPMPQSTMSSQPTSAGLAAPQNSMMQQPSAMSAQPSALAMNNAMTTMPNAYAHGGRTKRGKMVMAHFNPRELDTLDHLQGKVEKCPRSGMRSYTHLEELLKNPHILANVHHHTFNHKQATAHAHGGPAMHNGSAENYHDQSLNAMAGHGVHGDSELALIGPHMHHVLSSLAAPGTIRNHQDGRPQYWSLGSSLSGLWNTIKGGAQAAAPYIGAFGKAVMPMALPALEGAATAYGGPLGGMAAGALGNLANKGFDALQGMGTDSQRGMASTLGEGLSSAMQARQGGASGMQSLGAGLGQVGSRFGGGVGGAMQGLGGAMQQQQPGSSYGDMARSAAKSTAMGAYQGMGGNQGAMNAARGAVGQYMGGMTPRQIAHGAAQNAMHSVRSSVPTTSSMQNQDAFANLPGSDLYQ